MLAHEGAALFGVHHHGLRLLRYSSPVGASFFQLAFEGNGAETAELVTYDDASAVLGS